MIRRKKETGLIINIDGPEGNAFAILGLAQNLARQLQWESDPIIIEMQAGDYNNLLKVFNKYFPDVILETQNEEILKILEKE